MENKENIENRENRHEAGVSAGRAHALLGASSSARWLNCMPSAVVESRYPESSSEFAREGTLAHAFCALTLKERLGMDASAERVEIGETAPDFGAESLAEMRRCAEEYADYVMERREALRTGGEGAEPVVFVERRLDYSEWVPEGFGTGDAVIVSPGCLEVIDFKYGRGVEVSAERNTQMMLYALGAFDLYDYAYDFRTVRMTIWQPRAGNFSVWETGTMELLDWAENVLEPTARLAAQGLGVRASGAWCRFCRAKGDCPRLAADSLALHMLNPEADGIGADVLPGVLERLPTVSSWLSAVEASALERAMKGERIEGWKVVAGRRTRRITDPDGLAARLTAEMGLTDEQVWRPRELRTVTELERAAGRKRFAEASEGTVTRAPGKPTLVPESDRRAAWNPADDFDM